MKPQRRVAQTATVLAFLICMVLAPGLACAQDALTAVPSFTVNVADYSQLMPPTYTVDPYTGQTIQGGGYTLENMTVQVKIQNQFFTSITLPDGNVTELRYVVRYKGTYQGWGENDQFASASQASIWGETTLTYFKGWAVPMHESWQTLPGDAFSVDFEVKAQVGYTYTYQQGGGYYSYNSGLSTFVVLAESDWSSAQTVTLTTGSGNSQTSQQQQQPQSTQQYYQEQYPAQVQPNSPAFNLELPIPPVAEDTLKVLILAAVLGIIAVVTVVFVRASLKPLN